MDGENLLFDLAWKEVDSIYKYIEIVDNKAQMMMIVISIVLPLLISSRPSTNPVVYFLLIVSFACAFLAMIEYIEKLDNRLDEMIKFVNLGYTSQTKMELVKKFREASHVLKEVRDKKLKYYAYSGAIFFTAILMLLSDIFIFSKMV